MRRAAARGGERQPQFAQAGEASLGFRGSLAAISVAAAEHGLEDEAVAVVIPVANGHGTRAREAIVPVAVPVTPPLFVAVAVAMSVIVAVVITMALVAMRFRRCGAEGDCQKSGGGEEGGLQHRVSPQFGRSVRLASERSRHPLMVAVLTGGL